MAELFSRYASGIQWTAGAMTGSVMGISGINPMIDRLNSISTDDNLITGSMVSGTSTSVIVGSIIAPVISGTGLSKHAYSGTYYWSCAGVGFVADEDYVAQTYFNPALNMGADAHSVYASATLPHGALILAAVVYGSATDETWALKREPIAGGAGATLGGANIDTEDTSIDNATVDNSAYSYYFDTSSLDTNDVIDGARITYTL